MIDLRTLAPLDADSRAGIRRVRRPDRVVVVHRAPRTTGIGAEVAALIQERALYSLQAPVQRVTGWDTVFPLKRTEDVYLPDVERIVTAARRTLEG